MSGNLSIGTLAELRRITGDIDDATAASILSLDPTLEDVEEAVAWAEGRGDAPGNGSWPLTGKAGEIFEILVAGAEEESLH
jgi:hypothetical protein